MADEGDLQRELEEAMRQDQAGANHDPDIEPVQVISYGQ